MTAFINSFVRSLVGSLEFVRSFDLVRSFVRSISFAAGGNVLLPHFTCRVLYRWLYSLWKSVICVLLPHFLCHVLYRWLYSLWKSVI